MNFQLTSLSKFFPKPCMFLLLLCLGTILASICPASCQPRCSPPPSSGSVRAAWFHPFSRSTTAPTQSCTAAPAPSPSESGRGTRWLPSAASRFARMWTPHLAARVAAADRRVCTQAVLPQPSGSCFQTCWFLHLLFRCHHETVPEPFSYLARRFLHARDRQRHHRCHRRVPIPSTGTATEVGPLTSSPPCRGQSSGGALWTPAYIPGDRPASWMYSTTCVQYLYISCYLSGNKPVLSYLKLCLLPQYKERTAHRREICQLRLASDLCEHP
jgi:hypothetical protein